LSAKEVNMRHPDAVELDAVIAGDAPAEDVAHAGTCSECSAALEELRALRRNVRIALHQPVLVPADVDRRVLAIARPRRRLWPIAAAAAAGILVGLWLALPQTPTGSSYPAAAPRTVDIVDAYTLALSIRDGRADPARDVNGDGVVDMKDVDALAREAVSIGRRP
jgi:hypothetical protein